MKRWAFGIASLYVLVTVVLMVIVSSVATGTWPSLGKLGNEDLIADSVVSLTLFICQFAMLMVPVRMAGLRPPTGRTSGPAILVSGFMMAGLALGAGGALCDLFHYLAVPIVVAIGLFMLLTWLSWLVFFFRLRRKVTPADLVSSLCGTLLKASILALFIAIPCYLVASHRAEVFFSGGFSIFGVIIGPVVMLLSFGPAVFLLIAASRNRSCPAAARLEMDSTRHLMSRKTAPLIALGVLACTLLALALNWAVKPLPTAEEKSRLFTQELNGMISKDFERKGWINDGKGGWTSNTNRIQTEPGIDWKKMNAQMSNAGWIVVSNGHYAVPTTVLTNADAMLKWEQGLTN